MGRAEACPSDCGMSKLEACFPPRRITARHETRLPQGRTSIPWQVADNYSGASINLDAGLGPSLVARHRRIQPGHVAAGSDDGPAVFPPVLFLRATSPLRRICLGLIFRALRVAGVGILRPPDLER